MKTYKEVLDDERKNDNSIMTKEFKYFVATVLMFVSVPVVLAFCIALFVPTLGHSWKLVSKVNNFFNRLEM